MTFPHEPIRLWKNLISGFEATNPSIHIEPVYQEVGANWYKQADVAMGLAYAWWQDVAEQEGLLHLTPLIEANREFQPDDFYPGMLSLYRQDGHTWAIPYGVSHAVLVYAPPLFQEIGIPIPALDWTWADLWEAARRITTSSSIEHQHYSFLDQTTLQLLIPDWIAERSGGLYQEQNGEVAPVLNTSKVQQVVAECLGIAGEVSALLEEPADMAPTEVLDRVARGEVGMALLPLGTVMRHLDHYPELALASLPPGEIAAQTVLDGWSELFISAGTTHRQAAWQWVRFLSHQDLGQWRSGDLPARRSVARLNNAWEHLSQPAAAVVQQNIEVAGRGYLGFLPQAQEMRFLLEQQGIPLFTNDRPPRPRFTHLDVIQALERWQRLSNETLSFPLSYQDAVSLRRSGRVGMWFDVFNYWPANAGEPRMIATPIQLRVGTTLPIQVNALGLTPDTVQPEFCWEWITFLVQRGVSPDDELPALQYLAEEKAAANSPRQELYLAYLEMLRRAESAPIPNQPRSGLCRLVVHRRTSNGREP